MTVIDVAWDSWHEQWEAEGSALILRLLLVSPAAPGAVAEALQAALDAAGAAFGQLPPREELEGNRPWFGHWEWVRAPDGIVVFIKECDDLPLALEHVVNGLRRRAIPGRLEPYRPEPARVNVSASMPLTCHIRVAGERRAVQPGYVWEPRRDAHETLVRAACEWCHQVGDGAEYALDAGQVGPIRWTNRDDVVERVLDALQHDAPVSFVATRAGGGRWFATQPVAGRMSLRVLGTRVDGDAWREELAALVDVLRATAESIAYAYIARGHGPGAAKRPWGPGQTDESFEDLYVPDAFGVQLLAPTAAERLPPVTLWRVERVGQGAALLSATEPAVWFADGDEPSITVRARAELAPILYTKGILHEVGYDDVDRR